MDDCALNTREEVQVYVLALVPLYHAQNKDSRLYESAINKIKARETLDRETLRDILVKEVFKGNTKDCAKYEKDFLSAFDDTVSDRAELSLKIKKLQALTAMRPQQMIPNSSTGVFCAAYN